MASPATLRAISVTKTCGFLRSGTWKNFKENPFSSMPACIVQELLSSVLSQESKLSRTSIAHLRPLLICGRFAHVNLPRAECIEDCVTLLRMLSRGCQNLRRLSLLWGYEMEGNVGIEVALKGLLQNCARLEDLHSDVYLGPDHLKNCGNLKSLRLHLSSEDIVKFTLCLTPDVLKKLGSIEIFSLCHHAHFLEKCHEIIVFSSVFQMLAYCSRLTSVGSVDSSMALAVFHDYVRLAKGTPRVFKLRKCYWSTPENLTQTQYCDVTRVSAMSCPMLEALVMKVQDAGSLRHLKILKNVTCLALEFDCLTGYEKEFHSLLKEMGPQLRHLNISGGVQTMLSLNVICGNSPNLTTLQLQCEITADEQPCVSLLNLKYLSMTFCDRQTLLFMLSNCLNLKVLCLHYSEDFDDSLLHAIHRRNYFAELEVALILRSSLSLSGLTSFIQSAVNLKKLSLYTELLDNDEVVRCVRDLNPSVACDPWNTYFKFKEEEFPVSCWL